jgi:hypothetical protein
MTIEACARDAQRGGAASFQPVLWREQQTSGVIVTTIKTSSAVPCH